LVRPLEIILHNYMNTVHATETEVEMPASEGAHAEVAVANQSVAASLGLNTQLFVFQLVNFVIVALILWYMILKPLTSKLTERKKIIDESLDRAKEIETTLAMSQNKYQEVIDDAKSEAASIAEAAYTEGARITEDMKNKSKREIELLVDQAKRNIAIEKKEMLEAVRTEAADMVVAALEKILGEKMDPKKDHKLAEAALDKMRE